MTLLEACEPFFQKVCDLNRIGHTQPAGCPRFEEVRRDVVATIEATRSRLFSQSDLQRHWIKIEVPLLFFVDSMISESQLPIAAEWNRNRLAYDYKELAGDQKFFDHLNETLREKSDEANERLTVYYTCLSLGFTGYLSDKPHQLRPIMLELIERIDPAARTDSHRNLCPEAYENVDTRDLIEPPPISQTTFLGLFACLLLVFIAVALFLYQQGTLDLRSYLLDILSHRFDDQPVSGLKISL